MERLTQLQLSQVSTKELLVLNAVANGCETVDEITAITNMEQKEAKQILGNLTKKGLIAKR